MSRFMKTADYAGYIKDDIKTMIAGNADVLLIRAEERSIATITEYLGGIYDCAAIFAQSNTPDTRNLHIVKIVMALSLFDLYHQTGVKDVPEHRKMAYDDAISWLKDAGRGNVKSTLPVLPDTEKPSDFRMNSKEQRQHKW